MFKYMDFFLTKKTFHCLKNDALTFKSDLMASSNFLTIQLTIYFHSETLKAKIYM